MKELTAEGTKIKKTIMIAGNEETGLKHKITIHRTLNYFCDKRK